MAWPLGDMCYALAVSLALLTAVYTSSVVANVLHPLMCSHATINVKRIAARPGLGGEDTETERHTLASPSRQHSSSVNTPQQYATAVHLQPGQEIFAAVPQVHAMAAYWPVYVLLLAQSTQCDVRFSCRPGTLINNGLSH
jgi:hypothetical protein